MQMKKILVPIDLNDLCYETLSMAVGYALQFEGRLLLLNVLDTNSGRVNSQHTEMESLADYHSRRWRYAQVEIEKLSQRLLFEFGIQTDSLCGEGDPAKVIIDVASEERCDFVLMLTHGRTGLAHMLVGSVGEQVVRNSPCPVLTLVRPYDYSLEGIAPFIPEIHRILVPCELNDISYNAIDAAATFANGCHAQIDVLHVLGFADSEMQADQLLRQKLLPSLEDGIPANFDIRHGFAFNEILKKSEVDEPDLIVMGTEGRTGWRQALHPSLAERIVRSAHCPVLTVHAS